MRPRILRLARELALAGAAIAVATAAGILLRVNPTTFALVLFTLVLVLAAWRGVGGGILASLPRSAGHRRLVLWRDPRRLHDHPDDPIIQSVWPDASATSKDTVRFHVASLRRKLEPDPSNPRYLVSEPWIGYRFIAEPL